MLSGHIFMNATMAIASLLGLHRAVEKEADDIKHFVTVTMVVYPTSVTTVIPVTPSSARPLAQHTSATLKEGVPSIGSPFALPMTTAATKKQSSGSWWGNAQGNMYAHNHLQERGLRDGLLPWRGW